MDHWFTQRPVRDLLPGDHAWFSYVSEEEQHQVIGAFVRQGLATCDKVVYISDTAPHLLPGLRGHRDLGSCVRGGRLAVVPRAEACLTDGVFDPARLISAMERLLHQAEREQFRGLRITTDMTWAVRGQGDLLLACEAEVDAAIAPSTMAMAICQVDQSACTDDELTPLKHSHEVLVGVDPDFDDGVLTIVRTFRPRGLRLAGELDGARHAVFAEALRAVTEQGGEVHLNLSALRFIDLGALNAMAGARTHMGPTGRLVLDDPSPDLSEVVKLGKQLMPDLEVRGGEV